MTERTDSDKLKRRNRAVALCLIAWVVILFIVSIVKMQGLNA